MYAQAFIAHALIKPLPTQIFLRCREANTACAGSFRIVFGDSHQPSAKVSALQFFGNADAQPRDFFADVPKKNDTGDLFAFFAESAEEIINFIPVFFYKKPYFELLNTFFYFCLPYKLKSAL